MEQLNFLDSELDWYYSQEVNVCVQSEWDAHWTVKVGGDHRSGWNEEAYNLDTLTDVANWLHGRRAKYKS